MFTRTSTSYSFGNSHPFGRPQSAAAAVGRMGKKKGGDAGGGAPPLPEEVVAAIAYLSKYVDPASPLHADADEQAKAEKAAETLATFSSEIRLSLSSRSLTLTLLTSRSSLSRRLRVAPSRSGQRRGH